ncbi:putative gustatory receptor 93b [Drosophila subpulchrella]|uniref:putative gustatory receptor 93b n=1 Tax=Drosophila subpulchrella TaxID=1486046 RepID=UPI0018A1A981|nr:putative gustatory receptor 93b [Drosophila subpulchrella]
MYASKFSSGILRGMFFYARCLGLVAIRLRKPRDKVNGMEKTWCIRRAWWKWFPVIWRLLPVCAYVYTYGSWIWSRKRTIDIILNTIRLVLSIVCYLSMIYVRICHGSKVAKLISRYLAIFMRKNWRLGGGRELFLIFLSLCCHVQEIMFLWGILKWVFSVKNVFGWATYTYVVIASNMIMRINFIWYLSLGVLYRNLNENLNFQSRSLRYKSLRFRINRTQRLKKTFLLFRELSYVVPLLQDVFNVHLFLNTVQTVLHIVVISYKMIIDLNFTKFWLWLFFLKNMVDLLILTLAIQEAVNQFRYIREHILDIFFVGKSKDWIRSVEMFVTHLNLNEFRVRLLGLFDVSNKLFLVIASGLVIYLVFIVQFVMQIRGK